VPGAERLHLEALPILSPDRRPAGWFVGLVDGDRLPGFVQLDTDLQLRRASSFGGGGQPAADWLDAKRVGELASAAIAEEEQLGEPFLSYDGSLDRLGWIVPAELPDGRARRLMVAGSAVFEVRESGGEIG
jgi:hypothetical protein